MKVMQRFFLLQNLLYRQTIEGIVVLVLECAKKKRYYHDDYLIF